MSNVEALQLVAKAYSYLEQDCKLRLGLIVLKYGIRRRLECCEDVYRLDSYF